MNWPRARSSYCSSMSSGGDQFQQGVAERRGVAASECEQQVLRCVAS